MKPWRKSFGIWVPSRSLRDNRGFISPALIGAVAGSRKRVSGGSTKKDEHTGTTGGQLSVFNNWYYLTIRVSVTSSYTVSSIKLPVFRTNSSSKTLSCWLYSDSENKPNLALTGGAASNAFTQSDLPTDSTTYIEFTGFTCSVSLGAYWIVLKTSAYDSTNLMKLDYVTISNPGYWVAHQSDNATSWNNLSATQKGKYELWGA